MMHCNAEPCEWKQWSMLYTSYNQHRAYGNLIDIYIGHRMCCSLQVALDTTDTLLQWISLWFVAGEESAVMIFEWCVRSLIAAVQTCCTFWLPSDTCISMEESKHVSVDSWGNTTRNIFEDLIFALFPG